MEKTGDEVFELFTIKSPRPVSSASQSISEDISEIEDVFVKAKSQKSQLSTRSTPSKSDTRSYREKINERFKNVREKAGKSSRKASVGRDATYRWQLDKVRKESRIVDVELATFREKSAKSRAKSSDDFFRNMDGGSFEKSTEKLTENKGGCDLEFANADWMGAAMKSSETEMLFHVESGKTVSISDKIGIIKDIDKENRESLQEEKINNNCLVLSNKEKNLLDQRLSKDDEKWFDCEGNLKLCENPTIKSCFRPKLKPIRKSSELIFSPKIIPENLQEIVVISENILVLQILNLKFTHHPYFSIEHVLASKLKTAYKTHKTTNSNNTLTKLQDKLDHERDTLGNLLNTEEISEEKVTSLRKKITKLENKFLEENRNHRKTIKTILQTWKIIKTIRQINGYSTTSFKLTIHKETTDFETDKVKLDTELQKFLQNQQSDSDEQTKEQLLQKFTECFRPPGEPILAFTLSEDQKATENPSEPKEIVRRSTVSSTKIYLRILCNQIEVCKTPPVNLNADFSCHFEETISIQLQQVPKFITIEIYEQTRSLLKNLRGEIRISLPGFKRNKPKRKSSMETFEKAEIIHCNKHSGVGSGVPGDKIAADYAEELKFVDLDGLKTAGLVFYNVYWEKTSKYATLVDKTSNELLLDETSDAIIDKYGKMDLAKLNDWVEQLNLNSQDDGFFLGDNQGHQQFRLNPFFDKFVFVSSKVIDENARIKVLQLRNQNEPEFDGVAIPNRIREVPFHLLENYERRMSAERVRIGDEEDSDEEIGRRRGKGKQALRQVHIRVFQMCKNSENNLSFEDIVDEKLLPYFEKVIKGLASNFVNWFKVQPLKMPVLPTLKPGGAAPTYAPVPQTSVVISVISGLNIPVRIGTDVVNPLLEIEYNGYTVRTLVAEGQNPIWNDTLRLVLENANIDYLNPNSLNGSILIKLFDETDTILSRFGNVKKRTWLGSVEVPISGIGTDAISGMFRVLKPNMSIGYQEIEVNKYNKKTPQTELTMDTFLNLAIALEPHIPRMNPSIDELPCSDLPYLKEHALKWNETHNLNYPNRKFAVFVIDSNASTNCICRYIKPLEPPQINLQGFDVTPMQCLRYVSLISFTDCNHFYQNICLTTNEFLKLMVGSILDHAIALTCYFLSLKLEAWLVLGFGLPHGSSAFVLVKEANNAICSYFVYDVVASLKVDITDPLCPLKRIHCVINADNVWANVQRNDNLSILRMDLTRRSDWLPLFDGNCPAPKNSIQEPVRYLPVRNVDELELSIDMKIRRAITKLRKFDRTIWNHNVSNRIKTVLGSFESTEMYNKSSAHAIDRIRECLDSWNIHGYIFSTPFSNLALIKRKVVGLGVHLDEDRFIEFASAVYAKCYPNDVFAVWIFVGTVSQK